MRRGVRSNSGVPSRASSLRICSLSAGWLTPQRSAARPKWRSSATARAYSRSRSDRPLRWVRVILCRLFSRLAWQTTSPTVSLLFPVLACLAAALALRLPGLFLPFGPWTGWLLALVMFGMGATLAPADFRRVLLRPAPVLAGLGLHYGIMPLAAWAIAHALGMPPRLAAGMILTGSVASGTASTVMVFVAGADVALSVTIGALSTLAGIVMTPLLPWFYIDTGVAVDVLGLLRSILIIVALPVALGLVANRLLPEPARRPLPMLSMLCVVLIIAVVVASSRGSLASLGPSVLIGVMLHNATGLLGGYWGGRLLGFDRTTCRTLAFEVGMQNSGLAATLARVYFGPVAALPGAVFSIWHNLSGSLLAAIWSRTFLGRDDLSREQERSNSPIADR